MKISLHNLRTNAALMMAGLLLFTSCATKKDKTTQEYTFFPAPPDQPRIQYLTGFGSESDLEGGSKFNEFVVGQEKLQRPIWKPYGISAAKGKIYVCDTQPKNINIVDLQKGKVSYLRPGGRGVMQMPINVAVDKDGTRYVTDTKRGQVLIYNSDNKFLAEVGKPGEMKPCGIALTGDRFYVADITNHCVRAYNKAKRELLFTLPRDPKDPATKLFSPTNIATDEKGNVYVSDTGGFMVRIFDAQGNFIRTIGEMGLSPGRFALPKGVSVDHEGRVYVVDASTAVVQIFDDQGRLLMFFGVPDKSGPGGLYLPAGITIDYDNVGYFQKHVAPGCKIEYLIYVTNQAGPQKVSVFGFIKQG